MEPGSHVPDFAIDGEGLSKLWSSTADKDDNSMMQRRQSKLTEIDTMIKEGGGGGGGENEGTCGQRSNSGLNRQRSGLLTRMKSNLGGIGSGQLTRRKSSGTGLLESGVIARAVMASADQNIEEGEAKFQKTTGRKPSIRQALLLREASINATEEDSTIFANEEEADRLQDVTFTFAEMAALDMCVSRGTLMDIIGMIHNGIRIEIENAITMVCAMRRIGTNLIVGDIVSFKEWWLVTLQIIYDYLNIETKIILPWIRNELEKRKEVGIGIDTILSRIPIGQTEIRKLAKCVTVAFDKSIEGSPRNIGEAGKKRRERLTVDLVVAFDRFITQIIAHMYDQENDNVAFVLENSEIDYEDMLKNVILHISKHSKEPDVFLVLCARWMKDSKAVKLFHHVLKESTNLSYNKLQSHYELNHGATVAVFKVKAGIL